MPTLVMAALIGIAAQDATSLVEVLLRVDAASILRSWKIKGIEVCFRGGRPRVCLKVENAWPAFLIETLDRGGESLLREGDPVARLVARMAGADERGLAGVSGPAASNHQMREAHVWAFTPPVVPSLGAAQALMVLPPGPIFAPLYFSEADSRQWRSGELDALVFAAQILHGTGLADRAGSWGPYYPRAGAAIVPSAPWMDLLTAVRAGRIPRAAAGRVLLGSSPWETRTGHLLQQVLPQVEVAIRIGSDIRRAEDEGRARRWRRLQIFLGIFEGCARGSYACHRPRQVEPRAP